MSKLWSSALVGYIAIFLTACGDSSSGGSKKDNTDNTVVDPELTAAPSLSVTSADQGDSMTITLPINSAVGLVKVLAHEETSATSYNYPVDTTTRYGDVGIEVPYTGSGQDLVVDVDVPTKPGNWLIDISLSSNNDSEPALYRYSGSGAYTMARNCHSYAVSGGTSMADGSACSFSDTEIGEPPVLQVNELSYAGSVIAGAAMTGHTYTDSDGHAEYTTAGPTVTYRSGTTANPGELIKVSIPVDDDTVSGRFYIQSPYEHSQLAAATLANGEDEPYSLNAGMLTQYLRLPEDMAAGSYTIEVRLKDTAPLALSNHLVSDYTGVYMKDVDTSSAQYRDDSSSATGATVTWVDVGSTGYVQPACDSSMPASTALTGATIEAVDNDGTPELSALPSDVSIAKTANCLDITVPVDADTEFVYGVLWGINDGSVQSSRYSAAISGYVPRGTAQNVHLYMPVDGNVYYAGSYYMKYYLIGGNGSDGTAPSLYGENYYEPMSPTGGNVKKISDGQGNTNIDSGVSIPIITVID